MEGKFLLYRVGREEEGTVFDSLKDAKAAMGAATCRRVIEGEMVWGGPGTDCDRGVWKDVEGMWKVWKNGQIWYIRGLKS